MADIKDILGMSRGGGAGEGGSSRAVKEKMQRPQGMSREAFALLGGSHPIMTSQIASELKKKSDLQKLKEKQKAALGIVVWQSQQFINPARSDTLQLSHWVKCHKDNAGAVQLADPGPYHFVKYNKKMPVFVYDDEEWEALLEADPAWSRSETDYLLDLCRRFDLRFILIADRYQFPGGSERCVEDLKARYYAVARQLLTGRDGGAQGVGNQAIIKHPYNAAHERERKRAAEVLFSRAGQLEPHETALLEQAAAIEERRRQEAIARKPAPVPQADVTPITQYENVPEAGVASLFDRSMQPLRLVPGVHARGAQTALVGAEMLTSIPGGSRPQKIVETMILDMGCAPLARMPTRAICGAWLALRAEAATLQDLKRRVNELNRNRTAGAAVGGVATPSDLTPVSAMGTVSYTPGSGELDDGNRTKRIKIKMQAPGRFEEQAAATPRSEKRPRTAKKAFVDE